MSKLYAQKTVTVFSHSGSFAAAGSMSGSQVCEGFARLVGGFRSDIVSETGSGFRIEQSFNGGQNWSIVSSSALASACAASSFNITVTGNAARVFWRNGASAASTAFGNLYLIPV